jgi:hypothetical protein
VFPRFDGFLFLISKEKSFKNKFMASEHERKKHAH